jgi:8-oxo-dGTP pyrophosphatase MutT (NUDIX family)
VDAAVAIIFRQHQGKTQFLMMQRSQNPNDPWSGQMAFPGGKIDPEDLDAKHAAIREAEEEVGLDLNEHRYLGQLNDFLRVNVAQNISVRVSPFVFELTSSVDLRGNYEVADLVWVNADKLNTANRYHQVVKPALFKNPLPGVMLNEAKDQVLWGLSLRILLDLYALLGWPRIAKLNFET